MKTASELLDDLLGAVRPPDGNAIALRERTPKTDTDTNWMASFGVAPLDVIARYDSAATAELRRQHPRVDWTGISQRDGEWRHIAKYYSERDTRPSPHGQDTIQGGQGD
jgi:hypothetical protein